MTTIRPLEVHALTKTFGPTVALDRVSLAVEPGSITALLGPNGAGKSTLVNCCAGLAMPTSGTITIHGTPVGQSRAQRAALGVMLQVGGLPAQVTPRAFLHHVARLHADPLNVSDYMTALGITEFDGTTIRRLSGGQRQRVAFLAAIVGRPDVLFLDEPTSGMDAAITSEVHSIVTDLRARGCAIVLTTHNMAEATALADHVVMLNDGRVSQSGTATDIVAAAGPGRTTVVTDRPLPPDAIRQAIHSHRRVDISVDGHGITIAGHLSTHELHRLTGLALDESAEFTDLTFTHMSLADAVEGSRT